LIDEDAEGKPMSVEELIVQDLRALPLDRQREVLDFVQFLKQKTSEKKPLKSAEGLLAGLGIHISAEDIDEARREMWGNFPREDI